MERYMIPHWRSLLLRKISMCKYYKALSFLTRTLNKNIYTAKIENKARYT